MSGLTTKEMLVRVLDSVEHLKDMNVEEHKELSDKIHALDLSGSNFMTKVKSTASIISAISAIVVTVIIKIIF